MNGHESSILVKDRQFVALSFHLAHRLLLALVASHPVANAGYVDG